MDPVLEPIVILGIPRSGSSMTAGIFAIHGVWVGKCREPDRFNPSGYFENLDIKKILIDRWGKLAQTNRAAIPQEGFIDQIRALKPGNPWLAKHSSMYWRAWNEFCPKYVCVRRSLDGVIGSNRQVNFLGTQDENQMRVIIAAHNYCMDLSKGVNVYVDEVINGNYQSLRRAFKHCGIPFDRTRTEEFVNPTLWRRWSA